MLAIASNYAIDQFASLFRPGSRQCFFFPNKLANFSYDFLNKRTVVFVVDPIQIQAKPRHMHAEYVMTDDPRAMDGIMERRDEADEPCRKDPGLG